MGEDKTSALEKKKIVRKGLSTSFAPPPSWNQGDWLPSGVTEKELLELVTNGLIPKRGWRLLESREFEPVPHSNKRILLISHIDRGFSMPPINFFVGS